MSVLKLASIAVNRTMPMPEGLKETTKFTVIAMYIEQAEPGEPENANSTRYAYHHCDDWQQVIDYITANPLGTPLTTVH
jgi:hypothetical protein